MEIRQLNRTINADNIAYVNTLQAEIFELKAALEGQRQRHEKQLATLREQLRFAYIHANRLGESGSDILMRYLNPNLSAERLQRRVSYLENELARVGNERKLHEMGQICTLDDALRREQRVSAELLRAKDAELEQKSEELRAQLQGKQQEIEALREENELAREELEAAYGQQISERDAEIQQLTSRAATLSEHLQNAERQLSGSQLYSKQLERDNAVREQRLSAMQLALSELAASRDALVTDFERQSFHESQRAGERLEGIYTAESNRLIVAYQEQYLRANEALTAERSAKRTLENELSSAENDKQLLRRQHAGELAALQAEMQGARSKMKAKMLAFVEYSKSDAKRVDDLSQKHSGVAVALDELDTESQLIERRLQEQATEWRDVQAALEQKCAQLGSENEELRWQLSGASREAAKIAHILNIPANQPLQVFLSATYERLATTAEPGHSDGENDTPTVQLSRSTAHRTRKRVPVGEDAAKDAASQANKAESGADSDAEAVGELRACGVRTAFKNEPKNGFYVLETHKKAKDRHLPPDSKNDCSYPSENDQAMQTSAELSASFSVTGVQTAKAATQTQAVYVTARVCTAEDLQALRAETAILRTYIAKIDKNSLNILHARSEAAFSACTQAALRLSAYAADLRRTVRFSELAQCEDRLEKCIGKKLDARSASGGWQAAEKSCNAAKNDKEGKDCTEGTDKELDQAFAASLSGLLR